MTPTAPLSHRDNECASRATTTGSAGIDDSTASHGAISSPLLRPDGAQAGLVPKRTPSWLLGYSAGIAAAVAALGAAEGAPMLLRVLQPVAAVSSCFDLNVRGLYTTTAECIALCAKWCKGVDEAGCQADCWATPPSAVRQVGDLSSVALAAQGGDVEAAQVLVASMQAQDGYVRFAATAFVNETPLCAAMLDHNEQGGRHGNP